MTAPETHRPDDQAPVEIPLSFGEELLWAAQQPRQVATPFFDCPSTVSLATRLRGPLDIRALAASYNDVMRRHDVLRSRFSEKAGRPTRIVVPFSPVTLETLDHRPVASGQRSAALTAALDEHIRDDFDLASGSPVRARLVTLDVDDHVFVFTAHHLVFDGWSRRVLARELERGYGAYVARGTPDLPPLAAGYHDYVRWQRSVLEGSAYRTHLDYWSRKLAAAPDLCVPANQTGDKTSTRADSRVFTVRAEDLARLRLVSRAYGATLAMGLLAVFTALLRQLTGTDDIVVGMPVSDRRRVEFEDLIGLFTNVVVVRTSVATNASFGDLITSVRDGLREAYLHQDLPYGHLVQVLHRHAPLYSVVFNYTPDMAGVSLGLQGLDAEPVALSGERKAVADISLHIQELRAGSTCRVVYKAERFSSAFIDDLARRFQSLVAAAAEAPAQAIETIAAG